ncbi:MAG: HAD-IIA family hydrolase [Anaerolineaceae bacterium]|nr:HAD-IIA family hydrolase [Anaerolineaceae bacterium]
MATSLSDIKCFLLDLDGTFILGNRLIEGSVRFLDVLQAQGKEFLFLTNNSSKHRRMYAEKLNRLGVSIPETLIFTSGEATSIYLKNIRPAARLYVVGTPALEDEFRSSGFILTEDTPDIAVLGFDTTLTYAKLWRLCDVVRSGLPYVATHPDFNCPTETGFMPDIGAMIAFVKASTGREPDQVIGKPNRFIVDAASHKLNLPIDALAMVGDRLYTDIALGASSSITTVLVLSGETSPDDLKCSAFQPTYTFENLGYLANRLTEAANGLL